MKSVLQSICSELRPNLKWMGLRMPRQRGQEGSLEKVGKTTKKWLGHYYLYVPQPDGSERHVHKEKILGSCSELNKAQAKEALRRVIAESTGKYVTRSREATVEDVCRQYLTMRKPGWSQAMYSTVKSVLERHVVPHVGSAAAAGFTLIDAQTLVNKLDEQDLSDSAIKKARMHLGAAMAIAAEAGVIERNPISKQVKLPKFARKAKRFLEPAEIRKLLAAAPARDYLILRISLICALRPEELFALRWNDKGANSLRIDEAVTQRLELKEPKTPTSDGIVYVPASLDAEIESYRATINPHPTDFIFPSESGGPMSSNNYVKRNLKRIANCAGIDAVDLRCLRRTCATHMQKTGSVKDAQAHLRHSDPTITAAVYQQTIPEEVRRSVEELDKMMFQSSGRVQ